MGGIRRKKNNNDSVGGPPANNRKVAPAEVVEVAPAPNSDNVESKSDDGASGVDKKKEKKNSLYKRKKCRILAHLWDPRIKGCCFVPA